MFFIIIIDMNVYYMVDYKFFIFIVEVYFFRKYLFILLLMRFVLFFKNKELFNIDSLENCWSFGTIYIIVSNFD